MKYVAIDIGNVCIAIDKTVFWHGIGLTQDTVLPPSVHDSVKKLEFGMISENKFFEQLAALPECRNINKEQIIALYDSILLAPVTGMKELLLELPQMGVTPIFFSDISTFHLKGCYERFPEMRRFDGIFSFDYGAYKPDKILFDAFEKKYGKPLVYTDDRSELIDGALKNNWNAHRFVSAEILKEQIIQALEKI